MAAVPIAPSIVRSISDYKTNELTAEASARMRKSRTDFFGAGTAAHGESTHTIERKLCDGRLADGELERSMQNIDEAMRFAEESYFEGSESFQFNDRAPLVELRDM